MTAVVRGAIHTKPEGLGRTGPREQVEAADPTALQPYALARAPLAYVTIASRGPCSSISTRRKHKSQRSGGRLLRFVSQRASAGQPTPIVNTTSQMNQTYCGNNPIALTPSPQYVFGGDKIADRDRAGSFNHQFAVLNGYSTNHFGTAFVNHDLEFNSASWLFDVPKESRSQQKGNVHCS
jgi:hypothetical protein